MRNLSAWFARGALAVLGSAAVLGALDANDRWGAVTVRGDRINHAGLSYGLALLLAVSFRHLPIWAVAAVVVGLGVGLEAIQAFGFLAGDAQLGDLIADAVGVAMALLPLALGRRRPVHGPALA